MRIESKLCEISDNKVIVQVNGYENDKSLGSALAEGKTVEEAEDKAIFRLNKRLNTSNNQDFNSKSNTSINNINNNKVETINIEDKKFDNDPNDWSQELTAIDSEIERLNWDRDKENEFLEITFGYNNRNKITNYKELLTYLNILKMKENNTISSAISTNINDLINESELILKELSWDYKKGREYLQKEYNVSTRKELDEKQLISFVASLRSIRNKQMSKSNFTK